MQIYGVFRLILRIQSSHLLFHEDIQKEKQMVFKTLEKLSVLIDKGCCVFLFCPLFLYRVFSGLVDVASSGGGSIEGALREIFT